jgi:hypothetical protein
MIQGGLVGDALAVIRQGGSKRLYEKMLQKFRPAFQLQWLR